MADPIYGRREQMAKILARGVPHSFDRLAPLLTEVRRLDQVSAEQALEIKRLEQERNEARRVAIELGRACLEHEGIVYVPHDTGQESREEYLRQYPWLDAALKEA